MPSSSTADEGDRRGIEIHPADAPHAQQRRKIEQARTTAVSTTAASTAFGRFSSRPVRNSRHSASVIEAKTSASGVRAPALSLTADCDRPPATG